MSKELNLLLAAAGHSLHIEGTAVSIVDESLLKNRIGKLVEASALASGPTQGWSRFLVRSAAQALGIFPASIHDLYAARGSGNAPMTWSTPAFNLRVLSYNAARAMFRAAQRMNAAAFIFEIARSEMIYTAQRPAEYSTNILAAAIAEGFRGPVFIQGDHFQVSAKKFASDPRAEVQAVKDLCAEAIAAGFFNLDIDTSTLVDMSKPTVAEQQKVNFDLSAELGAYVRSIEPQGVTVSIGGEIGEVGGHNSNEEELRAFMDGYIRELENIALGRPGLSKISIQTGTSHGGTVLPDGSLAEVNIDFNVLRNLSRVARADYAMGGTVQHGASTLPEQAFGKFVENEAIEVHLATNFMNMFFEQIPADLKVEMYKYVDVNSASERKPEMSDQQFYYKVRKNAVGPFKAKMYGLPPHDLDRLDSAWEKQFEGLFRLLGMQNTKPIVDKFVKHAAISPDAKFYLGEAASEELADDLAD